MLASDCLDVRLVASFFYPLVFRTKPPMNKLGDYGSDETGLLDGVDIRIWKILASKLNLCISFEMVQFASVAFKMVIRSCVMTRALQIMLKNVADYA